MSTCCLCGAEASSAESWTGLVAGIPDPVAVCSEACMEQLWWVVDKGPPFGSAVSQPRSGASAVCVALRPVPRSLPRRRSCRRAIRRANAETKRQRNGGG